MSSDYIRRAPCPGQEFGLEDCESYVYTRGYTVSGGYWNPDETVEEEEFHAECGCEVLLKQIHGREVVQKYYNRVWELLNAAEPEADYPVRDYD